MIYRAYFLFIIQIKKMSSQASGNSNCLISFLSEAQLLHILCTGYERVVWDKKELCWDKTIGTSRGLLRHYLSWSLWWILPLMWPIFMYSLATKLQQQINNKNKSLGCDNTRINFFLFTSRCHIRANLPLRLILAILRLLQCYPSLARNCHFQISY